LRSALPLDDGKRGDFHESASAFAIFPQFLLYYRPRLFFKDLVPRRP